EVVSNDADLMAVRPEGRLSAGQSLGKRSLRLGETLLVQVEHGEVLQRRDDMRARRAEAGLENVQCAQPQLLCLGEPPMLRVERGQIVDGNGKVAPVRALHLLIDVDGLAI